MKSSEIKGLTTADLVEKIAAEKAELNKMKMDHVTTPLENTSLFGAKRKDIARMMTELRNRELTANK